MMKVASLLVLSMAAAALAKAPLHKGDGTLDDGE